MELPGVGMDDTLSGMANRLRQSRMMGLFTNGNPYFTPRFADPDQGCIVRCSGFWDRTAGDRESLKQFDWGHHTSFSHAVIHQVMRESSFLLFRKVIILFFGFTTCASYNFRLPVLMICNLSMEKSLSIH